MRIIDPREQHARRATATVPEPEPEVGYREQVRRERPRCGVTLPQIGEPCARRPGHGWDHRSAYAMDNAARMRTGRYMRPGGCADG